MPIQNVSSELMSIGTRFFSHVHDNFLLACFEWTRAKVEHIKWHMSPLKVQKLRQFAPNTQ